MDASNLKHRALSKVCIVCICLIACTLISSVLVCSCGESTKNNHDRESDVVVSPLTGLPLQNSDSLSKRALAVKVENHPDARPQSGLNHAEVVYEELVEGGVTRFIAIYLDSEAEEIGPVRSARPMDTDVLACIDPLFAVSGGSPQVMQIVMGEMYVISGAIIETADYFFRSRDRRAPHNLYTSTELLWSYCDHVGIGESVWEQDLFCFGDTPDADACRTISIDYPGTCAVEYEYNVSNGNYLRSMAGDPHIDKITGDRTAPTTVIIQYVELQDTGVRDMAGDLSPDAIVLGAGKAMIFTDGKVFHGNWRKDNTSEYTSYIGGDGEEIPIKPGQVWVHLVPQSVNVSYRLE